MLRYRKIRYDMRRRPKASGNIRGEQTTNQKRVHFNWRNSRDDRRFPIHGAEANRKQHSECVLCDAIASAVETVGGRGVHAAETAKGLTMEERKERCETCRFWYRFDDGDQPKISDEDPERAQGSCERGLRHVQKSDLQSYHDLQKTDAWAWPTHEAYDWCGEWQAIPLPTVSPNDQTVTLSTKGLLRLRNMKANSFNIRMFDYYAGLVSQGYSRDEVIRIGRIPVNAKNKLSLLDLAIAEKKTQSPA